MAGYLPWETGQDPQAPVNPLPSMAQVVAPMPPAGEQPGLWDRISQKLQNDPAANMALLAFGARALQGQRPGQTGWGGLADAVMAGQMAHQATLENQQAQARQQQEMEMKQAESKSLVAGREATTEATKQGTKFSAEKQPLELEKLRNEQKAATLKVRIAELDAVVEEAKARDDPTGEKRAKLARDTAKAELARVQAATAASRATAATQETQGAMAQNKLWAQQVLMNPDAPQTLKDQATTILYGQKTAAGQKKEHMQVVAEFYKKANPNVTDAEAAQYALEAESGMKGEAVRAAITLYNSAEDEQVKKEMETVLRNMIKRNQKPAAAGGTQTLSEEDITSNMQKYGKTRAQVLAQAKAKGYQVPEK